MSNKEYSTYTRVLEVHKINEFQYIPNREISVRLEHPFLDNAPTNLIIPARKYYHLKKSKKMGTLLLIGTLLTSAALTAVVLPLPWSLVAIGFGGPIITLGKKMFRE